MSQVTGTVGWVGKNKFGKYSLKLEDNPTWYNSQYEIKCGKGDEVEFDDADKKYVNGLRVTKKGAGGSMATGSSYGGSNNASIVRQNALRHAGVIVSATVDVGEALDVKSISRMTIDIAKEFEKYINGNEDVEDFND